MGNTTMNVNHGLISGTDRVGTRGSRVSTLMKNLGRKRRPGGGRKMLTPNERKVPTFRDRDAAWEWVTQNAAWIHKTFVSIVNEKVIKQYTVSYRGKPLTDRFRWNAPKGALYLGRSVADFLDYLLPEALEAAAVAFDRFDPAVEWKHERELDTRLRWYVGQALKRAIVDEARRVATSDGMVKEVVPISKLKNEPVPDDEDGIVTADKAALVLQALGSLSPVESKALELYAEGRNYADIATLVGLTDRGHALKVVRRAKVKAARAIVGSDDE